ncbi:MAG TPA: asparagine synthase (glutamine-hydrolyzing) [Bacteroidales bacterium]|nr:asparagine synthase (glutamine-hydrolyzing) [Bacteroidales bacterium]HPS17143.1 asparagine synthase (glutamine-hydrolyzing) [Bacteroidales bacterium]
MCGITGIFSFQNEALSFKTKVENAVAKLHNRGPENSGTYFHNHVALGHTRLAIIDVTNAASQPFNDNSGRYTIIFNGEFFNFKEHREELLKKGIQLKSQSDTEVLLYLYITEGASFLEKINGFFAFAIYDKEEETLFVARDRFGVKPLVYYKDDEQFIFASEIKALLEYGINKELDETSLYQYLQLNYIPAPNSIFKNVCKLKPGNFLKIKGGNIEQKEYYKIPIHSETEIKKFNINYDDAKNKIHELLDNSVKLRMISDVPLGAFLSGGIDSSIVTALASRYTDKLKTFSIGYKDEPLFDETRYARLVANKLKTEHTEFILTNDDLFSVLFNVLDYTDEPFADSSALALNILSKQTRKHVTVALSGDGADELFGGYNKHCAEYRIRNAGITENFIKFSEPSYQLFPQSRNSKFTNTIRQLDRFAKGMNLSDSERYWNWCGFASEKEIDKLFLLNQKENYSERKKNILKYISQTKGLNDVLYTDMHLVLQNDMLVKVDMMSMENSLEVRTPFLDFNLVNYVFSLPSEFKVDKSFGKKILQDTFRNILPEEIYHRNKHGFEVPLLKWFRNELKSLIFDELLEEKFITQQNIFNPTEISLLKNKLLSNNPGDAAARIWALAVFQYWWKKYFV